MEPNHTKKHSHGSSRSKGSRSGSDGDGESTARERNEKKSLFQIGGGIPSFEDINDRLKKDTEAIHGIQISMGSTSPSPSSSSSPSPSSSSSDDMIELKAKQDTKPHVSSGLGQSQGSPDNKTPRFRVSVQTNASAWLPPLSPTKSPPVQVMEREGYDPQRIPSSIFEKSEALDWSAASNESLFSLRIGDNFLARDQDFSLARIRDISLARDNVFSYSDFKSEELIKSGELLAYCPSLPIHIEDSEGKTSDAEEEEEERNGEAETIMETESEAKSSMPILSWRDLSELDHNSDRTLSHSNNSDQRPTSLQSFSSPERKKSEKKTKTATKNIKKKKKRCCCCCCCCCKNCRTCPCPNNGCFSS
ncbi:PREDICTED: putative uncharacterized protein DDB_G0268590 [Tarenaya hassleriana]|uniref:putative uncharacterized protein DDB_G0268590 n=1 Tax=Tarenaya hassleriana TaxID=28532 RepID=UPI00053C3E79|nr:PREDICTED: putative uncharacterized protein DDB_G0268590 [Tarenaya hassleriana]